MSDVSSLDIRPPSQPWELLQPVDKGAYLSFYYSDSNSKIPVRDITRFGDSKSDPNIETMTYGLFSTCEEDMRRALVQRGIEHVFYCTTRTHGKADYWLAADEVRFVNPGFPLANLTGYLRGVRLDIRFRRFLYLHETTAERLLALVKDTPEATQEYIREIQWLEDENAQKHNFTYPNWKKKEGFDWNWARKYLGAKHDS